MGARALLRRFVRRRKQGAGETAPQSRNQRHILRFAQNACHWSEAAALSSRAAKKRTPGGTGWTNKFEELVAQAVDDLPETFREKTENVVIIVEDLPPEEPKRRGLLLGLFHGIPRTEKSVFYSSPPDRIFRYQRNIEAVCRTTPKCVVRSAPRCCMRWGTISDSARTSCVGCEEIRHRQTIIEIFLAAASMTSAGDAVPVPFFMTVIEATILPKLALRPRGRG